MALGLDATRTLVENDTGPFFAKLGDSFAPGPTGTNVGDVAFVLAPSPEPVPEPAAADEAPASCALRRGSRPRSTGR